MFWRKNGRGGGSGSAAGSALPQWQAEEGKLLEDLRLKEHRIASLCRHVDNLHDFAKQLGKIRDLKEVYRFVADVCIQVFEFDRINLLIADEKAGMLRCVETRGNLDEPKEKIQVPISPESGALYHSYTDGGVIVLDFGTKEAPGQVPQKYYMRKPWSDIKAFRSHSFIVGALLGRDRPVGIFAIDKKLRKLRVTEDDIGLVKLLRDIASYAIQSIQTVDELKVHQTELYALIRGALGHAMTGKEKAVRMSEVTKELMESSTRIAGITRTIETIAIQTNLVSINAAIEAAKAGTVGMSFGVVADEVKRLAGQTHEATDEIGDIIKRITDEIRNSNVTMGDVATAHQELIRSIEVLHEKAQNLA